MENDLLEISGEDDDHSLLQNHQALSDHVSTPNTSYFSCSPLHFPRSNPADEKAKNPSFSSTVDKENIINNAVNKSELTKLSLEPQQMKRKKKAGGYNLRKSLAWDSAFFTEEGVLNSTELSLISGNFGNSSGEKLMVIEEEIESLSGDSQDLQALENNLFKELPLNNSNKKGEKKIGGSLLQKSSGPAPRPVVKQNVLSVQDVNRSGSKRSGCPRPVTSSAPANISSTKAAIKEPKISKIPAPKPDSSVLSTTAKIAQRTNKSKQNQRAQAVSSQRSIGLKGSNKTNRSTKDDAKSSLPSRSQITKSTAQQAKTCVRSSALASHSSTYSQNPLVTMADNGLKVNQDPVVATGHGSINHEVGSSKITSLPRSGCHIRGSGQYAQPQMAKPSGLRMPSPSLGFFTQSKTIASHKLQTSTQSCNNPNSNIPNLRKLVVLNSICERPTPSVKVDAVANDVAAITKARMSNTEPSFPSSANTLCENIRPNSRASKMLRLEVKVPSNSKNHELENNQQQLPANDNGLKQQIENVGLQCTDNKLLLPSQPFQQVKLDCTSRANLVIPRSPDHNGHQFKDSHFLSHHSRQIEGTLKAEDVGNQLSGNEQHNSLMEDFDLFPQLHSSDANNSSVHGSPKVKNDQKSILDSHEQSSKQAEQVEPCVSDDDRIINESERPHINEGTLLQEGELLEEFLSYNSVHSKGICPEVRDCSAGELKRTDGLSQYRDTIQGKDGTDGADDRNLQSDVALGNEQMHAFEGNLSLESSSGLLNASEACNQYTLVNDVNKNLVEQPPLLDPGIIVEMDFQDNCGSHLTDCLLHGKIFSSEELQTESNVQSVKDVASEIADACQGETANPSAPCWIPPALQTCVHEMAEVVECLHVENVVSFTQCNHDIEHLYEATSKELERIEEDQVTGAISACDIAVSNGCQNSGNLNGCETDNSDSISHISPLVPFKGYTEVDDIIDHKGVQGNQCCLSVKCNSSISKPGEKITSCQVDAPAMLCNSSIDKQNDCEKSIVQAEVIHSSEAGKAFQVIQIPEACLGPLSMEGKCFKESQNFDNDNCADVSPNDKSFVRQAAEGPSDLSQIEPADEPNEKCAAGVNEMTTRSSGKDVQLESFDDGISFDSCKNNLFTLAENNNCAVDEDLNEPPELQNVVIVEPIMSDKFGLSINEEISSNVKIKLSDNNHDCYNDTIKPGNEQNVRATSLNFELSSLSKDQISEAGNTCKFQAFCSLNEESTSSVETSHTSSSANVLQEEVNRLENDVPHELNSAMICVEANDRTTSFEKTGDDKKQDASVVKPPLNVAPFSDEWLAAIEAAGEEILTMKSGAVQNSPKDKSIHEPGPWSPVRRKNNQGIGPFDCTKFTNSNTLPGSD